MVVQFVLGVENKSLQKRGSPKIPGISNMCSPVQSTSIRTKKERYEFLDYIAEYSMTKYMFPKQENGLCLFYHSQNDIWFNKSVWRKCHLSGFVDVEAVF